MATLPSNRTIDAVLLMAPAVHATGPRGAFTINGSQSYENLYTLERRRHQREPARAPTYPLYIEDALQEVTVATAGVSAEYGRFSGGMVERGHEVRRQHVQRLASHVVRERLLAVVDAVRQRPKRARRRAAEPDEPIPMYEATLGGPVAKDGCGFSARPASEAKKPSQHARDEHPYTRTNDEKRYEGKLTYAPRPAHSLQGSYIKIDQTQTNFTSQNVMDLVSLTTQRQPRICCRCDTAGWSRRISPSRRSIRAAT